ncbi:MAG: hypothetical protein K2Y71_07045 [Xanthobacteraceae bacterium]|nr:hypothetical protein [Xanthobacteraceae bacterium]
MVATKRRKPATTAEDEDDQESCAVATITRLIHELYAANSRYAVIREGRDSDLIAWNEILGAVRSR